MSFAKLGRDLAIKILPDFWDDLGDIWVMDVDSQ
jgi:hypothetical protein